MNDNQTHHITKLLWAWGDGDQTAYEELAGLVYQELHRIARRQMQREHKGHTLNPSALVNEAFLKLPAYRRVQWQNRLHFFNLAARLMRRVLVNYAKSHQAAINGGGLARVTLDDALRGKETMTLEDVLALDEALDRFAAEYDRCERVVELKFFAGLTNQEVAELLGLCEKTVQRNWTFAQLWLRRALSQ